MTYAASLIQAVSYLQIRIFIASVTLEKQEQFLIISWYELTVASPTIAYANFFSYWYQHGVCIWTAILKCFTVYQNNKS